MFLAKHIKSASKFKFTTKTFGVGRLWKTVRGQQKICFPFVGGWAWGPPPTGGAPPPTGRQPARRSPPPAAESPRPET